MIDNLQQAGATGDDAELLAAYRQIKIAEAGLAAIADDASDEDMAVILDPGDDAYDRLEALQAQTLAGLRAKADAMRWAFERMICLSRNYDGRTSIATINEDGDWHERIAWSLARDVLAMEG